MPGAQPWPYSWPPAAKGPAPLATCHSPQSRLGSTVLGLAYQTTSPLNLHAWLLQWGSPTSRGGPSGPLLPEAGSPSLTLLHVPTGLPVPELGHHGHSPGVLKLDPHVTQGPQHLTEYQQAVNICSRETMRHSGRLAKANKAGFGALVAAAGLCPEDEGGTANTSSARPSGPGCSHRLWVLLLKLLVRLTPFQESQPTVPPPSERSDHPPRPSWQGDHDMSPFHRPNNRVSAGGTPLLSWGVWAAV